MLLSYHLLNDPFKTSEFCFILKVKNSIFANFESEELPNCQNVHTSGRDTHRMSLFSCVQGPRSLSLTVELSYHISSYDTEEVVKPPIFVSLIIQFPSTFFVYKIFVGFYHKQ